MKTYQLSQKNSPQAYFHLVQMGSIHDALQGKSNEPHRHDFYTILLIEQGKGQHLIDFQTYPIENNSVFFVGPGQVHQVDTSEKPKGWVIAFNRDFLAVNGISENFLVNINLFRQHGESPPLFPTKEVMGHLCRLMEEIQSIYQQNLLYKKEALGALIKVFLIYCNSICVMPNQAQDFSSQLLSNFKKQVSRQFKQEHKVKFYAEQLHITAKHLNEVVKELTGYTAKEYIQDTIIMEAKRLLRLSSMTIKEIAYELGFATPSHFSAFFKKCTEQSPAKFRLLRG